MTQNRGRVRGEHGWAVIEATLLLPVALLVLGFLVLAGRLATATSDVTAASRDAARAASQADTATGAELLATSSARRALADQRVTCGSLDVRVDTARFAPGGEVAVTVSCTVNLADVVIPGIPGERTVSATSVEVIDRLRSVGDGFSNSEGSAASNSGAGGG